MTETIAELLQAHRTSAATPADTVARSFARIRAHNDPAIFISLRDESDAVAEAKALAEQLAKFPQTCLRSDRRSSYEQWGLDVTGALVNEGKRGAPALQQESRAGAARFAAGKGRGGNFGNI